MGFLVCRHERVCAERLDPSHLLRTVLLPKLPASGGKIAVSGARGSIWAGLLTLGRGS